MNQPHEHIVTVHKGVDWRDLHHQLTTDTTHRHEVDSQCVPDEPCVCCKLRPISRNTHYMLTDEQAGKLIRDPRVLSVISKRFKPPDELDQIQPGWFPRFIYDDNPRDRFGVSDLRFEANESCDLDNWGLLNHSNPGVPRDLEWDDENKRDADRHTYEYTLDGTGVDVVIIDDGVMPGHPEFDDAEGNTRIQQINWQQAAPNAFANSGTTYNHNQHYAIPVGGHGTHVAGTVAGRTHGWAKNAHIYRINHGSLANAGAGNIDRDIVWDVVREWHNNKTNGRPTVVNGSYGRSRTRIYFTGPAPYTPIDFPWLNLSNGDRVEIHTARGINSDTGEVQVINFGPGTDGEEYTQGNAHPNGIFGPIGLWEDNLNAYQNWLADGNGIFYQFTGSTADESADVIDAIDDGIHVCASAGNSHRGAHYLPGEPQYDNWFEGVESDDPIFGDVRWRFYHNRGQSKCGYEAMDSTYAGVVDSIWDPARRNEEDMDWGDRPGVEDHNRAFVVGNIDQEYSTFSWRANPEPPAESSNVGSNVNMWAAGSDIKSAWNNALTNLCSVQGSDGTDYYTSIISGTSMSSPQVAGIVACLLQLKPSWSPQKVFNYFRNTSNEQIMIPNYDTGPGTKIFLPFSNVGDEGWLLGDTLVENLETEQARTYRITTS